MQSNLLFVFNLSVCGVGVRGEKEGGGGSRQTTERGVWEEQGGSLVRKVSTGSIKWYDIVGDQYDICIFATGLPG